MNNQAKKITKLCQQAWIEAEESQMQMSEADQADSIPVIWSDGEKADWLEEGDEGAWANIDHVVKFKFNETYYDDIADIVNSQLG